MKINYQNLEKKIKIKFTDQNLLIKSLTHKSYDSINNNEKVEFLGDRVLGLIIAKKLLEIYPNEKEGVLDKKFASLVNKKTCLEVAKLISNTGPRHKPLFKVAVKLNNSKFFSSEGKSKKDAEQNAANLCLESIINK